MEIKQELLSNELLNIDYVISLARSDSDIKQILLSQITKEFTTFYEDWVYEVIELSKHCPEKMNILISAILNTDILATELQIHFEELHG